MSVCKNGEAIKLKKLILIQFFNWNYQDANTKHLWTFDSTSLKVCCTKCGAWI
jgi:hypothetical protein